MIFGEVEADSIKRLLKLRKGSKLLDLCCGVGRHSVPLAGLGLDVTGLDLNTGYLRRARAYAKNEGVKADFVKGDMRSLAYKAEFNAVVNLFTSFGYYDDQQNQAVLEGVARALKPRGKFLIDVMNRDWLLKHFRADSVRHFNRAIIITEEEWNPMNSRLTSTWKMIKADKVTHMGTFDLRIYAMHELAAMIEDAGLTVIETFGGLDLSPFRMDSNRLVILAGK